METRKKLFGMFSGTHLTVIIACAIIAPTALLGASAFSNVVLQDTNGRLATVTSSGKLNVKETVLEYRSDPANYINLAFIGLNSNAPTCNLLYTVPSYMGLVITAIDGIEGEVDASKNNSEWEITAYGPKGCQSTGYDPWYPVTSGGSTLSSGEISHTLGTGVAIPAGSTIVEDGLNFHGALYIHGYLVPANAIPGFNGGAVPRAAPKAIYRK